MALTAMGDDAMGETGMGRARWGALTVALTVAIAACGGDDSDDLSDATDEALHDVEGDEPEQQIETPPVPSAGDDQPAEPADGSGGDAAIPVPIARFAAHGPQAENTIGPSCASGIDTGGGDVFRFTPPQGWTWKGTSGGSSYDQVTVKDPNDVSLVVTESAYDYDTSALREWQVIGPAGADIEIDGVTLPIMEVSLEGDAGYALVDFDYMSPMPGLASGASLGTVALTSSEPGRPTLDEAEQLLGTVRIERCGAVGEAMIWGPAGGARLVPRFEPDPMGKTYPDQPQPAYEPGLSPLDSYTLEQIAYLMPVEADVAMCAAEKAVEFGAGNPVGYIFMLTPSGTNTADLDAILAEC